MNETRTGVVQRIEDGMLVVAVAPTTCGGCGRRSSCGGGASHLLRIPADDPALPGARPLPEPGSSVSIASELPVVTAALLGYLWPVVALILGGALGQFVGETIAVDPAASTPDLIAAAGAAIGFFLAVLTIRRHDPKLRVRPSCPSVR